MRLRGNPAALFLMAVIGCRESLPTTPLAPLNAIRAASDRVAVDGRNVILSADVFRNFAPAPPGPRPLIVAFSLASDSREFPRALRADSVWVFHGDETWSSQTLEFIGYAVAADGSEFASYAARNGPEWPPGDSVDVAIRVTSQNGTAYFLQTRGRRIGAPS